MTVSSSSQQIVPTGEHRVNFLDRRALRGIASDPCNSDALSELKATPNTITHGFLVDYLANPEFRDSAVEILRGNEQFKKHISTQTKVKLIGHLKSEDKDTADAALRVLLSAPTIIDEIAKSRPDLVLTFDACGVERTVAIQEFQNVTSAEPLARALQLLTVHSANGDIQDEFIARYITDKLPPNNNYFAKVIASLALGQAEWGESISDFPQTALRKIESRLPTTKTTSKSGFAFGYLRINSEGTLTIFDIPLLPGVEIPLRSGETQLALQSILIQSNPKEIDLYIRYLLRVDAERNGYQESPGEEQDKSNIASLLLKSFINQIDPANKGLPEDFEFEDSTRKLIEDEIIYGSRLTLDRSFFAKLLALEGSQQSLSILSDAYTKLLCLSKHQLPKVLVDSGQVVNLQPLMNELERTLKGEYATTPSKKHALAANLWGMLENQSGDIAKRREQIIYCLTNGFHEAQDETQDKTQYEPQATIIRRACALKVDPNDDVSVMCRQIVDETIFSAVRGDPQSASLIRKLYENPSVASFINRASLLTATGTALSGYFQLLRDAHIVSGPSLQTGTIPLIDVTPSMQVIGLSISDGGGYNAKVVTQNVPSITLPRCHEALVEGKPISLGNFKEMLTRGTALYVRVQGGPYHDSLLQFQSTPPFLYMQGITPRDEKPVGKVSRTDWIGRLGGENNFALYLISPDEYESCSQLYPLTYEPSTTK